MDGGETIGDSGGVRLTVSQDAVQEFQINRSNYAADLGAATGASINIVTKSGTNNVHGTLYGFFRNDAMDARDPFAFSPALAPDPTSQFSTPLLQVSRSRILSAASNSAAPSASRSRRTKHFLFASFEGLRQNAQNSVPLLTRQFVFSPDRSGSSLDHLRGAIRGSATATVTPRVRA